MRRGSGEDACVGGLEGWWADEDAYVGVAHSEWFVCDAPVRERCSPCGSCARLHTVTRGRRADHVRMPRCFFVSFCKFL